MKRYILNVIILFLFALIFVLPQIHASECSDHLDNNGDGYCDAFVKSGYCADGSILGDPKCLADNDSESSACILSPEVCDGIDNDCNGLIDDSVFQNRSCNLNLLNDCIAGIQQRQCSQGQWGSWGDCNQFEINSCTNLNVLTKQINSSIAFKIFNSNWLYIIILVLVMATVFLFKIKTPNKKILRLSFVILIIVAIIFISSFLIYQQKKGQIVELNKSYVDIKNNLFNNTNPPQASPQVVRHIFYVYPRLISNNNYTKTCYPEGELMNIVRDAKCCQGLQPLAIIDDSQDECTILAGGAICSKCGNGLCNLGENDCNCPQDCNKPLKRI